MRHTSAYSSERAHGNGRRNYVDRYTDQLGKRTLETFLIQNAAAHTEFGIFMEPNGNHPQDSRKQRYILTE